MFNASHAYSGAIRSFHGSRLLGRLLKRRNLPRPFSWRLLILFKNVALKTSSRDLHEFRVHLRDDTFRPEQVIERDRHAFLLNGDVELNSRFPPSRAQVFG